MAASKYSEIINTQNNLLVPPTGCLHVNNLCANIKLVDTNNTFGMTKKTSPAMPSLTLTILTAQVARNINDNILIIIVKAHIRFNIK